MFLTRVSVLCFLLCVKVQYDQQTSGVEHFFFIVDYNVMKVESNIFFSAQYSVAQVFFATQTSFTSRHTLSDRNK